MLKKNRKTKKRTRQETAQRWASYVKAAGVGAFALGATGTTDAGIVGNGIHNGAPVAFPIVINPVAYGYLNKFDIDNDGIGDFYVGTGNYGSAFGQLAGAYSSGKILSSAPAGAYAVAFAAGATIDGASGIAGGVAVFSSDAVPTVLADASGFIGFQTSSGFFGWMDVSTVTVPDAGFNGVPDLQLTIHGWGYDNTGAGIAAGVPEPSSLALLAAGSVGLLARRRRKNVA